MKWEDVETDWVTFKETIRDTWKDIPPEEVEQIKGNRTVLEERIVERYGKTPEEARAEVDNWLNVSRIQGRL